MRGEQYDQAKLSRILDVAQDLKVFHNTPITDMPLKQSRIIRQQCFSIYLEDCDIPLVSVFVFVFFVFLFLCFRNFKINLGIIK